MRGAFEKSSSFVFQTNAATLHSKESKNTALISPSQTTETHFNEKVSCEHISRRKKSDPEGSPQISRLPSSGREDVTAQKTWSDFVSGPGSIPYMKINTLRRRKESNVAPPLAHKVDAKALIQQYQRHQSTFQRDAIKTNPALYTPSASLMSRNTWEDLQKSLPQSKAKEMAINFQYDLQTGSKIESMFASNFTQVNVEHLRTREIITRHMQKKLQNQRRIEINHGFGERIGDEKDSAIMHQIENVKSLILQNFAATSKSVDKPKLLNSSTSRLKSLSPLTSSLQKIQTPKSQMSSKSSAMYEAFKANMRREMEIKTLLNKPCEKNVDQNAMGRKNMDEQDHLDKIKFQRLQKADPNRMRLIVRKKFSDQSEEEQFYFRMYLQIKVPFFEQYDRLTMTNICKQLKQKVYDRGEVIVSKGVISDCMFVVLIGEAGVYENEGELVTVLTENRSIGERALRLDELTKYTVVAQKVSVCLSLQRLDFQKQVFHLEHELRISRFNYISSLPMTQGWETDAVSDLNGYFIQNHYAPTEVIYEIGQKPDMMYILRKGVLAVYCNIELEEENRYPKSQNTWEIVKTKRKIQYELRRLEQDEVFGHQELIENIQKRELELINSAFLLKPDETRKTKIVCLTAAEILTIDAEHFANLFSKFQMRRMMESLFSFDLNQAKAKVTMVLKEQKFTNKTILNAAKCNIMSTDGDASSDISKYSRRIKEMKQVRWIDKGKEKPSVESEMPKVNGVDRIKVFETHISRHLMTKLDDGSFEVKELTQKSTFNKLNQLADNFHETYEEIALPQSMQYKLAATQIDSETVYDSGIFFQAQVK